MAAILLTVALFALWLLVGHALLALLRPGPSLPNLLLAPAVGLAVTVLPAFLLSRAGLPVAHFAWPLALSLTAAAGILLAWLRPLTCLRNYLPVAGLLLLGLLLTGRPLLEFGFDWLSYCNDDMANYSLRALRLLHHGLGDVPPAAELLEGRDYSQFFWFMDVPGMARVGSDLVLAWVVSLTGLSPLQTFMPLILAFHLVLLSAGGSLVCRSEEQRPQALAVCGLLALSALTALGTLYQLLGQVAGLALLVAGTTLLLRPLAGVRGIHALRHGLLNGILFAALLVVYPEVFPFLVLALAIYLAIGLRWGLVEGGPLLTTAAIAVTSVAVLLGRYLAAPVCYLLEQMAHGSRFKEVLIELFPYYLLPSGFGNLWGLIGLGGDPSRDPLVNGKIVLGAVLLGIALVAAAVLTWKRGEPAAVMSLLMLAVAAFLFTGPDAYGLFKLAMFLQPFLLATLTVAWWGVARGPVLRVAPLLLLAGVGIATQAGYVESSRGCGAAFMDIPNPSSSRLMTEFRAALAKVPAHHLLLDAFNPSLIKFELLQARGIPTAVPSRNLFRVEIVDLQLDAHAPYLAAGVVESTLTLADRVKKRLAPFSFRLLDEADPEACLVFCLNRLGRRPGDEGGYLVETTPRLSLVNRRHFPEGDSRNFALTALGEVRNHLIFILSRLEHSHSKTITRFHSVTPYSLENDADFPGRTFAACIRRLLFEVVHPTPGARLALTLSTTYKGDGDNRLPPAVAIGNRRLPFGIVGRGSARVFSPPLTPQTIASQAYVGVDLGTEPSRFASVRSGLMGLYGNKVSLDYRSLVAFARDISLVSSDDYARLRPPSRVACFPADLAHPDLEYSGVYEDGWISEACFFCLARPAGRAVAVVRGTVPGLDDLSFTTELKVLVDGQEVARRTLRPGDFEVVAPAPPAGPEGRGRVELRFSRFQHLPGTDRRPVACVLKVIALESAEGTAGLAAASTRP